MKKNKRKKSYTNIMIDLPKTNCTAMRSYIVASLFYAAAGLFIFYNDFCNAQMYRPLIYYILLCLPKVLVGFDYKENHVTEQFRYTLFVPALFFYAYLLILDMNFAWIVYAVWLLGTSIIYYDTRFLQMLGSFMVAIHMGASTYLYFKDGPAGGTRLLYLLCVILFVLIINFAANRMIVLQQSKMKELHEQKQRFEALVSVNVKRIYEYNPSKDEFILFKTNENRQDHPRKIENFSEVAKQYRYVLYADWHLFDEFVEKCREGKEVINVQLRLRNKNADYLWYQISGKTLLDEEGNPGNIVGTLENIDEIKRYELRIQDENMRDSLSKLYKRAYAKQLMAEFLHNHDGEGYAGLLIIDIDNFGVLCEEMGNTFGDEVIRSMAADLESIFYTSDILGRVGGDEFVILMKDIRKQEDIEKKIHELQDVVRKTYTEKEMNFTSTVTIGVSIYPTDGEDLAELYYKAEKALAYAKVKGKDRHEFYDKEKESEYALYGIEDKHNKIKQKNEMEMLNQGNDTESLTELAFKLIEESKDTDSAINLLLRQVARQMDLDGICIRKRVDKENKLVYPYRCIIGEELPDFGVGVPFDEQQWESERERFEKNNGFLCCSDTSPITNEKHQYLVDTYHVKAFARSAFYERGEYIGSIDYMDCHKNREWTREERLTMQTLANVISSYLLKMKAFEDASDTVERLTGYDAVTNFYKYEKFLAYVDEYLATASKGKYVVVYMDFSNFKFINEVYGYEVGDKILSDYADSARAYGDIFIAGSRVFSDNMVCLIKMVWNSTEQMIERLTQESEKFTQKVQKEYLESNLSLMMGVCPFELADEPVPFKSIVSNANLARKEAKKPENSNCVVYDQEMGEKLMKEVSYVNDMENAFAKHEFIVYFQPKIDLKNHIINGAEALIRWIKQDGTMVYPNEFIPVFEKNKTITQLDYFVYEEVCKYLAERIKNNERLVYVSMNVSRIHLKSIDKLVDYISGLLKKYQVPPHLLEFELTETVFTDTVDDTIELMSRLRELGVKVSMDDFGSGYSSLNVLTKLPLDVLKLDKEFLKDFETDADGKIIIPSIIEMAKKLQLSVVCEGVETKQQVDFLRQVDCDLVQGYYYSRPVPQKVFSQMLEDDDFVLHQEQMEQ